MTIRILHLYPNLLNLYGEYANLSILSRYLNEEGVDVAITPISPGQHLPDDCDMLYIGSGTETASLRALSALLPYREIIKGYYQNGNIILATGNSFDLFGKSIQDERDGTYTGLGLFDYEVIRTHKKRYLGDTILTSTFFEEKVIGFVNKCSIIKGVNTPLFSADMGLGNDTVTPGEGFTSKNFFGTSLIGPLLIRNPSICRYIMNRLYEPYRYTPTQTANMCLQQKAYEIAYSELSAQLK